jgi:hypothetical protein
MYLDYESVKLSTTDETGHTSVDIKTTLRGRVTMRASLISYQEGQEGNELPVTTVSVK